MRSHPGRSWLAAGPIAALVLTVTVGGCGSTSQPADNATAASPPASSTIASPASPGPPQAPAASPRRQGPEMLSTIGLFDGEPLREVRAGEGTFTVRPVDEIDTLMVDGRPALYPGAGSEGPEPVAANFSLHLIGVFELPAESVAWALVVGGTACAGTHVLVPVRRGVALPALSIPGCGESGTMRLTGDRIVFEAGGSTGTYQNGLVKVEGPPEG